MLDIEGKNFSLLRLYSNLVFKKIHMYLRHHTCLNLQCIYVHSEKLGKILSKFQCCFHEILHLNPVTQVWLPVCPHISQAPKKRNSPLETIFDLSSVRHRRCTTTHCVHSTRINISY